MHQLNDSIRAFDDISSDGTDDALQSSPSNSGAVRLLPISGCMKRTVDSLHDQVSTLSASHRRCLWRRLYQSWHREKCSQLKKKDPEANLFELTCPLHAGVNLTDTRKVVECCGAVSLNLHLKVMWLRVSLRRDRRCARRQYRSDHPSCGHEPDL